MFLTSVPSAPVRPTDCQTLHEVGRPPTRSRHRAAWEGRKLHSPALAVHLRCSMRRRWLILQAFRMSCDSFFSQCGSVCCVYSCFGEIPVSEKTLYMRLPRMVSLNRYDPGN